jgi:hypothetical protein
VGVALIFQPAEIDAFYRDGDAGTLARIVDRRLDAATEKPGRLLIYVDQWEEVYAMAPVSEDKSLSQHRSDVDKFIGLLVAATSGADRGLPSCLRFVRTSTISSCRVP